MMRLKNLLTLAMASLTITAIAQNTENYNNNKFKQLHEEFATPNVYHTASGAPGHQYYQNRADYDINVRLDDAQQKIYGTEEITYHNNSPDELTYLWVQLDQNVRALDSDTKKIGTGNMSDRMTFGALRSYYNSFDGGFKIDYVKDKSNRDMKYTINKTMMRIDLDQPLKAGQSTTFKVKYWYNINNRMEIGGRSGYEFFEKDSNYLYTIAQFYPRMCVYNDVMGWQNKQFLGRGEFTVPFGDYRVSITVPADHKVAATGELQNASSVLTSAEQKRFREAKTAYEQPVIIVTQGEAIENEKTKSKKEKTWIFKATNVRDFGFASSRKFIWDAMAVKFGSRTVMAMSFYPKEGNPLWETYSTKIVAHTIKTYSKYTFDYPYPVAQSIHAASIGMEYPMICFNGGRPEEDGTYSDRTKYAMLGVIIHEVGHNFFPMIINSDERQWTWMDEGLNTFLQFLTEQEWERNYPSRRGPAHKIVDYMKGDKKYIAPIMTNSESIWQFGNNAYGKPCTALNILRETIMGRELFDFAFKTYAQRWMFKHPTPEDLFRTMEDASGVDLDWFWRGWFYTNDHVDISMDAVTWFKINTGNPDVEKPLAKKQFDEEPKNITELRNKTMVEQTYTEKDPSTLDFYNSFDPFKVTILDRQEYEKYMAQLSEEEKAILNSNDNFYEISFSNVGGLVMPIIIEFEFVDGTKEVQRIPAEIWKMDNYHVTKVFVTEKEVKAITLDPFLETADCDVSNNYWPPKPVQSRFQMYKSHHGRRFGGGDGSMNEMQKQKKMDEMEK